MARWSVATASASSGLTRNFSSASALAARRTLDVDLIGQLGNVRQDDHLVVRHLDEPAVHRERLLAATGEYQPHGPRRERAEELRVTGEERDVAAAAGAQDDHVGLTGVEHLLRRDELHLERHAQLSEIVLALASTDSTPPTLKNACSGTSSRSPLHSASKLSTVSSTGT